ncbi:hypothetical protein HBB16_21635 [Pseudonocardia sp. MCCB 268]|nr:hypothetical protein [Pseudonocardia cytotoxica]
MRTGDQYVLPTGPGPASAAPTTSTKVGGIWVSPRAGGGLLFISLAEAVVVSVPDADGLDRRSAFVVPATPVPPSARRADRVLRDGLAAFKRPRVAS